MGVENNFIFYQNQEFYLDVMVNSMLIISYRFMSNNTSSKDEDVASSEDSLISEIEFEINPGIEEEFQEKDQEIKESLPSAQQSKFVQGIVNEQNLLAPLVYTNLINQAADLANKIYSDLNQDSLVKIFIDKNINQKIEILGFIKDKNLTTDLKNSIQLLDIGADKLIPKKSGVYVFTHIESGKQYIGSAMNFKSRVNSHRKLTGKSFYNFVISNGGWKNFTFAPIYITTNFIDLFKKEYPTYALSYGEAQILIHLTHLEARLLEQSLLTYYKPLLNKEYLVNFMITKWDKSWLNISQPSNKMSKAAEIRNNGEIILTVKSHLEAAKIIGRDYRTLKRNIINNSIEFYSKTLGFQITVNTVGVKPSYRKLLYKPIFKEPALDIGIPLNNLPPYELRVYSLDKQNYKSYDSIYEAFKILNPSLAKKDNYEFDHYRRVLEYVNRERILITQTGKFYLAWNPLIPINPGKHIAIILVNLQTLEATYYNTMTDVANYLGVTRPNIKYAITNENHTFDKKYKAIIAKKFLKEFPQFVGLKNFNIPSDVNLSNFIKKENKIDLAYL